MRLMYLVRRLLLMKILQTCLVLVQFCRPHRHGYKISRCVECGARAWCGGFYLINPCPTYSHFRGHWMNQLGQCQKKHPKGRCLGCISQYLDVPPPTWLLGECIQRWQVQVVKHLSNMSPRGKLWVGILLFCLQLKSWRFVVSSAIADRVTPTCMVIQGGIHWETELSQQREGEIGA